MAKARGSRKQGRTFEQIVDAACERGWPIGVSPEYKAHRAELERDLAPKPKTRDLPMKAGAVA